MTTFSAALTCTSAGCATVASSTYSPTPPDLLRRCKPRPFSSPSPTLPVWTCPWRAFSATMPTRDASSAPSSSRTPARGTSPPSRNEILRLGQFWRRYCAAGMARQSSCGTLGKTMRPRAGLCGTCWSASVTRRTPRRSAFWIAALSSSASRPPPRCRP
ncbi:hypothetical protein DFJ74DRAFT_692197 [Hyaloraphidium curvatum]|nr:hypothetical protein DFJ74DRAFT_692197 [Hyaloraphidium curvatum]